MTSVNRLALDTLDGDSPGEILRGLRQLHDAGDGKYHGIPNWDQNPILHNAIVDPDTAPTRVFDTGCRCENIGNPDAVDHFHSHCMAPDCLPNSTGSSFCHNPCEGKRSIRYAYLYGARSPDGTVSTQSCISRSPLYFPCHQKSNRRTSTAVSDSHLANPALAAPLARTVRALSETPQRGKRGSPFPSHRGLSR